MLNVELSSKCMPSSPLQLSAVIITQNAAPQLAACLEALAFCQEIVVVDSGSTDSTLKIAAAHGARIIQTHWRGYGPQKQFAVTEAHHDWVLCIDSDEVVTPALAISIQQALRSPGADGFYLARRNRFLGKYLRHGEGYPDWTLRLFKRTCAGWSGDTVHERVICHGTTAKIAGDLLHDSATSLEQYLARQNRYSSLAAQAALERGERSSYSRALLSPALRFLKFYLLRLGCLDGWPGLVHILIGCHTSWAKHVKMLAAHNLLKVPEKPDPHTRQRHTPSRF